MEILRHRLGFLNMENHIVSQVVQLMFIRLRACVILGEIDIKCSAVRVQHE